MNCEVLGSWLMTITTPTCYKQGTKSNHMNIKYHSSMIIWPIITDPHSYASCPVCGLQAKCNQPFWTSTAHYRKVAAPPRPLARLHWSIVARWYFFLLHRTDHDTIAPLRTNYLVLWFRYYFCKSIINWHSLQSKIQRGLLLTFKFILSEICDFKYKENAPTSKNI